MAGSSRIFLLSVLSFFHVHVLLDSAHGQCQPPDALRFSSLDNRVGLSHNSVNCLLQDRKGLLWIGTQGGLNCFDGYEFKVFHHHPANSHSPSSESIYSLYQDRRGRLWVGTTTQLELWQDFAKVGNIIADCATSVSEDTSGGLWFACWSRGLLHLAPDAEIPVPVAPRSGTSPLPSFRQIYGLLADRQGRIWMGMFKQGLYCYRPDSGRVERIELPSTLPDGATDHVYHTIVQDHQERIWVASLQGLYCLDRGRWIHYQHDSRDPGSLANDEILALCLADSQHLWIGMDGAGLDCLDLRTGCFSHFPPCLGSGQGFPAEKTTTLLYDRFGILWAGTQGHGLIKAADGGTILAHSGTLFPTAGNWVHAPVWCFHEDSSRVIWIGSQAGLHHLDPSRTRATTEPGPTRILSGLPLRGIWVQNRNTLWLASQGKGLWQWRRDTGLMRRFIMQNPRIASLNNLVIYDLLPDGEGGLWIACNSGGVYRFDLSTETLERILLPQFSADDLYWATDLLLDGEQLWLATWNNGLYTMNIRSRQPRKVNWWRPQDLDQTYPLLSLHQSGASTLYVGTYGGGFYRLNLQDSTATRSLAPEGLSDNVIYAMQEDQYGHLWYSTNLGLISFDPLRHHFAMIDYPGGAINREFNLGASFKSRENELFFGGMNGFCRILPGQEINPVAPVVLIAAVASAHGSQEYFLPPEAMPALHLKTGDLPYRIKLLALHSIDPEKNQYAYALHGLHKEWIDLGVNREIIFSHLPPGRYQLKIRAANSDGIWSMVAELPLLVTGPFVKSKLFLGSLLTGLLALAVLFYRARLYQVRAIERVRAQERESIRTRIAQDFHDELGHRLSKILLFTRTAANEKSQLTAAGQAALDKIIDNSVALNKEMRQFLWELDPDKDSLQDLLIELKHFSDNLFDCTEVAFELRGLVPELERFTLPLDWRSNILRIFKEGMVNIFKHAEGCHQVILAAELRPEHFVLQLINNGCGFDPKAVTSGAGLKNMQKRAEKIGGELQICSALDQTILQLIQPFHKNSVPHSLHLFSSLPPHP